METNENDSLTFAEDAPRPTIPTFPEYPTGGLQYKDGNGEWKDCSHEFSVIDGATAHEYRHLKPTNEQLREYGHKIVGYFADIAEIGPVCGFIEKHALVITCDKNGDITFAVGEKGV